MKRSTLLAAVLILASAALRAQSQECSPFTACGGGGGGGAATDLACTGCVEAAELASDSVTEAKLKSVNAATDEFCLTFETTTGDFEWQTCASGTGDVVGPASATDKCFARFDSTTGKLIQNSLVCSTDAGVVTGITQLNVDNLRLDGNTLSSTSGALVLSTASSTLLELAIGGSSKWAIDSSDLRALNFGAYVGVSGDSRAVFANGQLSLYAGAVEALRATAVGVSLVTANGAQWVRGQASELLTLSTSGTTTDTTANLLPANAIIEAVVARVTTTITTATDWQLGDTATAGRFTAPNATMTAGTTDVGLVHIDQTGAAGPRQTAAAKVRVTTTGTPGAGAVRITVFYRQFVAPTS